MNCPRCDSAQIKLLTAIVGTALLTLGIGEAAQATVLTFDDLPPTNEYLYEFPIPNGYGGLDWDDFSYVTSSVYTMTGSGYKNGTVSGENVAFNEFGNLAVIRSSGFNFNSAYLTGAWRNGLSIRVEGLNNEALLYSTTVVVDTTAPKLFNFNYIGINELRFTSAGGTNPGLEGDGTQFVIDNFTLTPVPEPASILGVTFAVFGGMFLKCRR